MTRGVSHAKCQCLQGFPQTLFDTSVTTDGWPALRASAPAGYSAMLTFSICLMYRKPCCD